MIEIKHKVDGRVLYTAENAQDVRSAVEEAVKAKANLGYANLRSANLGSADLGSADLRSADLGYANLGSANLRSADLGSADLGYADLRYANLGSANLRSADLGSADLDEQTAGPSHPLWIFRQDYWSILDQAPREVAGLRKAIIDGEIDGSVYEGACACLNGTIANVHGCDIGDLAQELGIVTDASRPAEQWYICIEKGDKPLPLDTKEWPSESVFRLSLALSWLDEWVASRTAIADAMGFKKPKKRTRKAAKKPAKS